MRLSDFFVYQGLTLPGRQILVRIRTQAHSRSTWPRLDTASTLIWAFRIHSERAEGSVSRAVHNHLIEYFPPGTSRKLTLVETALNLDSSSLKKYQLKLDKEVAKLEK
jgi:hypothetical protein